MLDVSRIGDRLKTIIPLGRGEQKALAYKAGISPETLNKILTGKTQEPGFEMIARIARAAGVSLDALHEGDVAPVASIAADVITAADRRRIAEFTSWASQRFAVDNAGRSPTATDEDNVLEFVPAKRDEKPKEMSDDELRRVAEALGDVIEFRRGALWKEYEVPLVATVSAGSGIEIFETYEKVRQIPEYYWKAGARAVFKVRGHSMLDMGITDNDLLFVRPTTRPKTGDVVICSLNGSAFVKEFERTKNGVRLVSHSEGYQPMDVTDADDLRVFGVVLGRTGDLLGERRRSR